MVLPDPKLANGGGTNGVVKTRDTHGLKVLSEAPPQRKRSTSGPTGGGTWKWLVGLLAIAALMGFGIWAGMRNTTLQTATGNSTEDSSTATETDASSSGTTTPESAETETTPVANASAEIAADVTEAVAPETPEDPASASTGADPITFQINLEGNSWMQVRVDGESVYEGELPAGTKQSWTAQSELQIIAGNSGAVLYSFNGSDEAPLGAPGSVTNLTLTPETDPQALQPQ